MLLSRARPSGQPACFVAQRLSPFVDESFSAQIILRTETLTFCFSLCSLQSPSFQVLGVNSSYRRELSHLPVVKTSWPALFRFLLFHECRRYLQASFFQKKKSNGFKSQWLTNTILIQNLNTNFANSFNTCPSTLAPFQLFSHLSTVGRRDG